MHELSYLVYTDMRASKIELETRLKILEERQIREQNVQRAGLITKIRYALKKDIQLDQCPKPKAIEWEEACALGSETKNPREQAFILYIEEAGYKFTKRGWPDFMIFKDGGIACVEVKMHERDYLRNNQRIVMEALASYGIPCYEWRPNEGFKQVQGPSSTQELNNPKIMLDNSLVIL